MKQPPVFLFLDWKGPSERAIRNEFASVLGANAIAYSTVTLFLRQRSFPTILVDPPMTHLGPLLITQFSSPSKINPSLLFGVSEAHLHSNYHDASIVNAITWIWGEASSLGFPQSDNATKS
jgi:hypothetical protein